MKGLPSSPIDTETLLRQTSWMRRLALGILGDRERADDVTQDTLVSALQRPPAKVRDERSLRAWLARVVRNTATSLRRTEARRSAREEAVARPEPLPSVAEHVERVAIQRELVDLVVALESPYREVIVLRYFDECTPREIAERLGISEGNVRTRLSRGVEKLRARMDQRFGGRRESWAVALASLGRAAPAAGRLGGGLLAGAALGTLVMKGKLVLGGALAVLALVVAHDRLTSREVEPATEPRPSTEEAAVSPGSLEDEAGAEETVASSERRAVRTPDKTPAANAGAATEVVVVEARVSDAEGRPIQGIELSLPQVETAPTARSDADGRVGIRIPWDDVRDVFPQGCTFELYAHGWTTHSQMEHFREPGTRYLGHIELVPGGDVHGYVFDDTGAPLAGAEVTPIAPLTAEDAERLRADVFGGRWVGNSAITGADGSYRLPGMPAKPISVSAVAPGTFHAWSNAFEVAVGGDSRAPDLLLDRAQEEDRIEGVVLDPQGAPLPKMAVRLMDEKGERFLKRTYTTEDGRFTFVVEAGKRYVLQARDPEERWQEQESPLLEAGTLNATFSFREKKWLRVVVVTEDGGRLRGIAGSTSSAPDRGNWDGSYHAETGSELTVLVPLFDFFVDLSAAGYEGQSLGPFSATDPPEEVTATLAPTTGIYGRVVAGGKPVAGAVVDAHVATYDGKLHKTEDGFHTSLDALTRMWAQTDEDGSFFLNANRRETYWLHAVAEGYARSYTDAIRFDPANGSYELEIELHPGGTVEGTVRVAPGTDPRGIVVGMSRGDGHIHCQIAGEGGRYRFPHLTPGNWQLLRCKKVVGYAGESNYFDVDGDTTPWDLTVVEGETTVFDLDLTGATDSILSGRIRFQGEAPQSWYWTLWQGDNSEWGKIDTRGEFQCKNQKPGPGRLKLTSPYSSDYWIKYSLDVELEPGLTPWERDVPAGTVELTGLRMKPESELSRDDFCYVLISRKEGALWYAPIRTAKDGRIRITGVPAGELTLSNQVFYWGGGQDAPEPLELELTLRPGADEVVEVHR